MVPMNPHIARTMATQRIQEHLDEAALRELACKGTRRRLGALFSVPVEGRQGRPLRLRVRIPGRAY
jgi:hypothetical protein